MTDPMYTCISILYYISSRLVTIDQRQIGKKLSNLTDLVNPQVFLKERATKY